MTRWMRPLAAAVPLLAVVVTATPAAAQIDYRNLDGGRPTRVTDAYPVERYAFELSLPLEWRTRDRLELSPHLEYGIGRNLAIGLGAEIPLDGDEATGFDLGALWNVRRETPGAPAFSLAVEARQPASGAALVSDASLSVGVLMTRSAGRARLHVNGMLAAIRPDSADAAPLWWVGAAWDYTLFRSSTLAVVEFHGERPEGGAPVEWVAGAGIRRQLTPTWVTHLGISQSFDGGRAPTRLHFGFSHAFAVAGLMRRGAR